MRICVLETNPESSVWVETQICFMMRNLKKILTILLFCELSICGVIKADDSLIYQDSIAPIMKNRCVKCHGPAKAEAGLDLSTASGLLRGGMSGSVITPHQVDDSLLWVMIDDAEMPPDQSLTNEEKQMIRQWIASGSAGLPVAGSKAIQTDHWAFRKLGLIDPPQLQSTADRVFTPVDLFMNKALSEKGILLSQQASAERLIRRVSLTLTGLPPTQEELDRFLNDRSPNAYPNMVERFLANPGYGVRWGKYWLDAAGYADSNGYFNADSDRPLAYHYRDYVIRSLNNDMPFDQFIREQIAGDEISGFLPGQSASPRAKDQLIATHFLRNGQDGTGESDGNPDERRADRFAVLESAQQIVASSLLGLTIQCAKCHSHKYEPITQQDYYRFQAVFTTAFPAADASLWKKPQERHLLVPTADQKLRWELQIGEISEELRKAELDFNAWVKANRPLGELVFQDLFERDRPLSSHWSNTAPGDDKPGGMPIVTVNGQNPPAARNRNGHLEIVAGLTLDSWLTTTDRIDWTPEKLSESIQVTFDLIDTKIDSTAKSAERIGYFIATHDFDDSSRLQGGNILIDGNPDGGSSLWVDYPGKDAQNKGALGRTGYRPGRNYGVRITNIGNDKFRMEHLVDGFAEEGTITFEASELPDGGFGFEYHANRSFIIDNLRIEQFKVLSG
ncbi:MAG: hypothetical protein RJA81_1705, partial [Planctomycetota bacterium]